MFIANGIAATHPI